MRILLVNPNMTTAMTDAMALIARRIAGDRAEIVPVTASYGFPYVASRADLIALARLAALEDGADVIILGGAPLAGLAHEIDMLVPALVIEPIAAATAQAIALASIVRPATFAARAGKPAGKASVGLSKMLETVIAGEF